MQRAAAHFGTSKARWGAVAAPMPAANINSAMMALALPVLRQQHKMAVA
jgi:hypothetical protein